MTRDDCTISSYRNVQALSVVGNEVVYFADHCVRIVSTYNLLIRCEELLHEFTSIRDLHYSVSRKLKKPKIPHGVFAAIVDIESNFGLAIELTEIVNWYWRHPPRKSIFDVEIDVP